LENLNEEKCIESRKTVIAKQTNPTRFNPFFIWLQVLFYCFVDIATTAKAAQ